MAKFCMQCGAPLNGARFCTKCGTPVEETIAESDLSGFDRIDGEPIKAKESNGVAAAAAASATAPTSVLPAYSAPAPQQTAQMPVQQGQTAYQAPATQAYAPANYTTTNPEPKKAGLSNGAKIGIIAAACALGVGAGVALAILQPWAQGTPAASSAAVSSQATESAVSGADASAPSSEGSPVAGDSSGSVTATAESTSAATSVSRPSAVATQEASTSSAAAPPTAVAQADYYDVLSTYYSQAAEYDRRIADAAVTFNNNYLKASASDRSNLGNDAHALKDELQTKIDELDKLAIAADSAYASDYANQKTLYNDLFQRIRVICEAWDISNSYSDASGHQEEIVAPLAVDNDSNGKNRYKKEFDELYPSAAPEKK